MKNSAMRCRGDTADFCSVLLICLQAGSSDLTVKKYSEAKFLPN
jgi:hypothetical protein